MKADIYICDWCKKETKEHYTENGWITIDKSGFHVSDNNELKIYTPSIITQYSDLHFCSIYCFLAWLFLSKENQNKNTSFEKRIDFFVEYFTKE